MSQLIQLNESTASNRIVYLWSMLSNGTSPAQFEAGGQPTVSVAGITPWNSAGTLLSVSTINGEYQVRLGTSDVSVAGPGILRYSSTSALETSIAFQVVAFNPYGSLSTFDPSVLSVGLKAVTHSGATVGVGGIAPATYSGVTVGVNNLAAGSYSGVTIAGVTSGVTLLGGQYSNVSIGGVTLVATVTTLTGHTAQTGDNFARIGAPAGASVSADVAAVKVDTAAVKVKTDQILFTTANKVDATISSGVTIATGGIIAASFGAASIDAVALATDAGQEIADAVLARNIAGASSTGRTVSEALYTLRNKVGIDGSIGTVYQVNDTTSAWTFSVTTVSTNSGLINIVDPAN